MIEVVAALIKRNKTFLICRRPENKKQALKWEFVGGKVEPGETKPQALVRECKEELDIVIEPISEYTVVTHEYPEATIRMTLFSAVIRSGEPKMLEHADMKWITVDRIDDFEFCPADVEILKLLKADPDLK